MLLPWHTRHSSLVYQLSRYLHFTSNQHWTDFVSNDVVWSRTGQPLLSETIRRRRLSFFGHLCRADANQDHSRALQACIWGPPKDWRRRTGRPRQTWLKTVEDDLRPLIFGLASARRRAWDRPAWRTLVEVATSSWHAPERETNQHTLNKEKLQFSNSSLSASPTTQWLCGASNDN